MADGYAVSCAVTPRPPTSPGLPCPLSIRESHLADSDFRVRGQPIELRPRFNGQVPQLVHGYRSRTVVTVISSRLTSCFVFVRTGVRGSRRRPSCRLGVVSDDLVRDVGEAVTECLGVAETQGLLVAGLAEEARAGPEHDREDLQPQLVDEVVLYQGARQLEAGGDLDFPV